MKRKNIFLLMLIILAVLAGCSPKDTTDGKNVVKEDIKSDFVEEDKEKEIEETVEAEKFLAPDFTLYNLAGEEVSLSDFRGKYVFINFWATWCGFCDLEMPSLDKLNKENDDLVVLAVDVMEDKKQVEDYIEKGKYEFLVVLDEKGAVAREYYVNAYPTTYFVDKEGYLITGYAGMLEYEQMVEVLNAIRGE